MAPTFLFDIGNVILKFDFSPAVQELAKRSTRTGEDVLKPIENIKCQLESGQMDDDSFITEAIDILGFEGTREEFAHIWCDIFQLNPPMAALIEKLSAAGHDLFLLSNTSGLHIDYILATFPVFAHFKDGVYSHAVRSEKPGPEIYQIAIDQFGLTPQDTIYIDDLPANISAGEKAGLEAHHYDLDDHEALLARLRARDVKC
jgi:FMN phosphatase YigB (HAD superfamily)